MELLVATHKNTDLPRRPGVYLFKDAQKTVLYVGKALSLRDRLHSYFQKDISEKTRAMLAFAHHLEIIETGSEFEALLLEAKLIKKHRPKYNVVFRDDKSYLYIFISFGEEFPKVFLTRKPKILENNVETTGEYFGPFPSSGTTKQVIKWLRRIIPFCTQKSIGNRACFYSHIGLCRPCPGMIVKQTGDEYERLKKIYRTNLFRLKRILEGNLGTVAEDLTKEMKSAAKEEDFETAQILRDQLTRLQWISQTKHTSAFLENPNFYADTQKAAVVELAEILQAHQVPIGEIERIECFDISTLQGTFSVASQIVFVHGIPEKGQYRKYRIKLDGKPNDVEMLKEAITRRLKHEEWPYPDLLIVDGGKPQVSTIRELLNEKQVTIPLIGLAKRWEQIVIPQEKTFQEIGLSRKHKALQLLQRMRDEAHRFAITYHRKRRNEFERE